MPNYLLAYHGGKMPDSQESVAKVMAAWEKWMKTLGPALIDQGNVEHAALWFVVAAAAALLGWRVIQAARGRRP